MRLGDIGRIRTVLAEVENAMRSPRTEEPLRCRKVCWTWIT